MRAFNRDIPMTDYAPLDDYEINLTGVSVRIIVSEGVISSDGNFAENERIVPTQQLKWRKLKDGSKALTLREIAQQINPEAIIYVWTEFGLSGEIFSYSNNRWDEHGTTRGYA